jgi:DNA recombination protein RmuC
MFRVKNNYQRLSTTLDTLKMLADQNTHASNELLHTLITNHQEKLIDRLNHYQHSYQKTLYEFKLGIQNDLHMHRTQFDERQLSNLHLLQNTLQKNMTHIRNEVTQTLKNHTKELNQRVEKLTGNTDQRLKEISGQVEKRLADGFKETTATFSDVVKRLALIDAAQQKITELSSNVVSLQEVLVDKKSRGAFGEVQLSALIHNMLPKTSFELQKTLSNGMRVDCLLYLPQPTGDIAIDAKFPLESYRQLISSPLSDINKQKASQQFRQNIKKHIQNIASKYILPPETADGAVMFIPAEAVFAEIHAHFTDLIEYSHKKHVWLVSPTTMMAILTTARAVLKDEATRKQVHIIQEHLHHLSTDFDRFEKRMNNLAKHVNQAHKDIEHVHVSAKKITDRFNKIEKVDLREDTSVLLSANDAG